VELRGHARIQRRRDRLHRPARAAAHLLGHERDLDGIALALRRRQLVVELENLHQEGGGAATSMVRFSSLPGGRLLAADVDAGPGEQIFGPPDRILDGPPGLIELNGARQRRATRARVGGRVAIGVHLSRLILVGASPAARSTA
jgi:hypothetical protein